MFTGIVEEMGQVTAIRQTGEVYSLTIDATKTMEDLKIGDSVAVNGICLTVVSMEESGFTVEVVPETVRRTNVSRLALGRRVNLERALSLGKRLGGHLLTGHIDGVGEVKSIQGEGEGKVIRIAAPNRMMRYVIEKGSIAVDGVSLTVMDVEEESFRIALIPHTLQETTLGELQVGDVVNLEFDLIGKYVEKLLWRGEESVLPTSRKGMTGECLRQHGFLE